MDIKVLVKGERRQEPSNLVHKIPQPCDTWGREFYFGDLEEDAWIFAQANRLCGLSVEIKVELFFEADLVSRYFGVETPLKAVATIELPPLEGEKAERLLREERLKIFPNGFLGCSAWMTAYDAFGNPLWSVPHTDRSLKRKLPCPCCGQGVEAQPAMCQAIERIKTPLEKGGQNELQEVWSAC
jgi:hypothetical protein